MTKATEAARAAIEAETGARHRVADSLASTLNSAQGRMFGGPGLATAVQPIADYWLNGPGRNSPDNPFVEPAGANINYGSQDSIYLMERGATAPTPLMEP